MLTEQGLGGAPLFVVPETTPVDALLPPGVVDEISKWMHGLAGGAAIRSAVVQHTLNGAVRSLAARVFLLAAACDAQADAAARLRREVDEAYDAALARVDDASGDGSLLRGDVLARWQEFVGTGDLTRALESKFGRLRDRFTAAAPAAPQPGDELAEALTGGLEALVRAAADGAAETAGGAWHDDAAGSVLAGDDDLRRSSIDLAAAIRRAVQGWHGTVLGLVREQRQSKRATARHLAFGVDALGLLVMIVAFTEDGVGAVAGASRAAALSNRILAAVFSDQAVRYVAVTSRADLHRRVAELLGDERRRYLDRLAALPVSDDVGSALRAAVQDIEDAR